MSDDIVKILNEMKAPASDVNEESVLFDMKLLNSIEDKVARGFAKKVYIKSRKESQKTDQVIRQIVSELDKNNKLDDSIRKFLEEIKW